MNKGLPKNLRQQYNYDKNFISPGHAGAGFCVDRRDKFSVVDIPCMGQDDVTGL